MPDSMFDRLRLAMVPLPSKSQAQAAPEKPLDLGKVRHAAVALVVAPGPQGWSLLMMKRADREGDPWSGHMSFPGGHVEPSDADHLHAAMREASEEMGLKLKRQHCLGELSAVSSPRVKAGPKRRMVRAFVFALSEQPELTLNAEAASSHWFPMQQLLDGEGRGLFDFEWKGNKMKLPRIDLQGQRIWGMSLGMLDELLDRIRRLNKDPEEHA